MSLRIPLSPDLTLQTEFHEIERRLRRLERSLGQSGSTKIISIGGGDGSISTPAPQDLQDIRDRLELLEETIGSIEAGTMPVFKSVGPTAAEGIVPSPETYTPPTGVADELLKDDATWGFPLRGLIGVTTNGTTDATDAVHIQAGLHVNGGLSSNELMTGDVTVLGTLILPGILATSEDELSVAGLL